MISKERLEELIEQGATIYEAKYHNINPVNLSQKIRCINYRYGMISFEPSPKEKYLCHKYFKNLFETEEDALWELEMTATRTETLKLPKWEEFIETNYFPTIYCEYCQKITMTISNDEFFLFSDILHDEECIFRKPLTKENYIEACKLCLRLFRGEEV